MWMLGLRRSTRAGDRPAVRTPPSALLMSLLMTAALGSSSCCDEACGTGLAIEFSTDTRGDYVIVIRGDGRTITCETTLPVGACGGAACGGDAHLSVSDCGGQTGTINGVSIDGFAPASVEITVTRDGTELAHKTLVPRYSEGCEGDCRSAREEIELE